MICQWCNKKTLKWEEVGIPCFHQYPYRKLSRELRHRPDNRHYPRYMDSPCPCGRPFSDHRVCHKPKGDPCAQVIKTAREWLAHGEDPSKICGLPASSHIFRKSISSRSKVCLLRQLRQRDGWRCLLCNRKFEDPSPSHPHPLSVTIDHVLPVSKGGTNEPNNLQLTHRMCNMKKHDGVQPHRFPTQKHTKWITNQLLHELRTRGLRGWRRHQVVQGCVPDVVFRVAKLAVYVYDLVPTEVSMVEGRALSKYGWKVIRLGRLDILGDVDKFIRKI